MSVPPRKKPAAGKLRWMRCSRLRTRWPNLAPSSTRTAWSGSWTLPFHPYHRPPN